MFEDRRERPVAARCVHVPEARIRELELRRRAVRQAVASGVSRLGEERHLPRTHVHLEGLRTSIGKPWPTIEAEVYRIAETADPHDRPVRGGGHHSDNRRGPAPPRHGGYGASIVTDRILAYEAAGIGRADLRSR